MPETFDISTIEEKHITFSEGFLFLKIARKIKIRTFKNEFLKIISQVRQDNINNMENIENEIKKIEAIENELERKQALLDFNTQRINDAGIAVGIDIVLYICESIVDAENEVYDLIAKYTNTSVNIIKEIGLEDVLEIFKIMWQNGLASIFSTFMNEKDDNKFLKKKK